MITISRICLTSCLCAVVSAALLSMGDRRAAEWPKLAVSSLSSHAAPLSEVAGNTRSQVMATYEKLPVAFEPASDVAGRGPNQTFFARGVGYTLRVAADQIQIRIHDATSSRRLAPASSHVGAHANSSVLTVRHVGISRSAVARTGKSLPGNINYVIGRDRAKWRLGVPTYASVTYEAIYSGVDVVYYGSQGRLEHDFVVAPHSDAGVIRFRIEGAQRLDRDREGNLVAHVGASSVSLQKPVAYQHDDDATAGATAGLKRHLIDSAYVMYSDGQIGFELGPYDRSKPLIIDPVLSYSTYLGGSDGEGSGSVSTAVDNFGNVYIASGTFSHDFPATPDSVQSQFGGSPETCDQPASQNMICGDAFVTKLNADGSAIVYSTYLGGSAGDYAFGLAVDLFGNAYVAGFTDSSDFPATSGAFQTAFGGRSSAADCDALCGDGFVAKIDPSGSRLVYSTYLGGALDDYIEQLAIDRFGNAYVTGTTGSANFPTTPGAFQPQLPSDFCPFCQVPFVAKLNETGGALVYSTFLGGAQGGESSSGIAVDNMGNAYVAGSSGSTRFPTTPTAAQPQLREGTCPYGPCQDGFVTKLDASGSSLLYSTFLGGSGYETFYFLALDPAGAAYVTGFTNSPDLPTTPGAMQNQLGGGTCDSYYGAICSDVFVAKVDPRKVGAASLVYSTYFGGEGEDVGAGIAVAPNGKVFVTGYMYSAPAANDGDAFVMGLNLTSSDPFLFKLLAGSGFDLGDSLALDPAGNVYVGGWTTSVDFPTTSGVVQPAFGGGSSDVFIVKLKRCPLLPAAARTPFTPPPCD